MNDNIKNPKDQRKKPNVHTMYYHKKGGADVADVLSTIYSTQIKS